MIRKYIWPIILSHFFALVLFTNAAHKTSYGFKNKNIVGRIENISEHGAVCGWAADLHRPEESIDIELIYESNSVASLPSTRGTTILEHAEANRKLRMNGNHGFCFELPKEVINGNRQKIHFYAGGLKLHTKRLNLEELQINKSITIAKSGGSNFGLIRHANDLLTSNPMRDPEINPWLDLQSSSLKIEPQTLDCSKSGRSIIASYHLYQSEIDQDLQSLYDSGQRQISLILWHTKSKFAHHQADWNKPCIAVPTENKVSPLIQNNIQNLILKIKSIGFSHIVFRFAPVDAPKFHGQTQIYSYVNPEDPNSSWGTCSPNAKNRFICDSATLAPKWNERLFQNDWNVLNTTRNLILHTLSPAQCQGQDTLASRIRCSGKATSPNVTFDLALEYGGSWIATTVNQTRLSGCKESTNTFQANKDDCLLPGGNAFIQIQKEYARRLWKNYSSAFGNQDTIGFSIVPGYSNFISSTIDVYDDAGMGNRPAQYGFDIYGNTNQIKTDLLEQSIQGNIDIIKHELASRGEEHKPIYIQETYFNSPEIRKILENNPLQWQQVFPWPLQFNSNSTNNIDDLSPFSAYQP